MRQGLLGVPALLQRSEFIYRFRALSGGVASNLEKKESEFLAQVVFFVTMNQLLKDVPSDLQNKVKPCRF